MTLADWVAVDYEDGTARMWRVSGSGSVLDAKQKQITNGHSIVSAIRATVSDCFGTTGRLRIVACGIAPQQATDSLLSVPCRPPRANDAFHDADHDLWILPGIKQQKPLDFMRGEETRIAGFLSKSPDFDGVICLPGARTVWTHLSAGEIVSFRSAMTGEMFSVLAQKLSKQTRECPDWNEFELTEAMSDTLARPETLVTSASSVVARQLLSPEGNNVEHSRLMGILIGAELAAMRAYWLGQPVCVIGSGREQAAYVSALRAQAVPVETDDRDAATLAGLTAFYKALESR